MAKGKRAEAMAESRAKLIRAARRAFATQGYAAASMDELTASVGLTRGALYHNFEDKKGLLWAVVAQIDGEMAERLRTAREQAPSLWKACSQREAPISRWRSIPKSSASCFWMDPPCSVIRPNGQARTPASKSPCERSGR